MSAGRGSSRLSGIEAVRGAAATLVVCYHAARMLDRAGVASPLSVFRAAHAGVDLFFVLSGFIILHVHRQDLSRPGRLRHFAWRRCLRILPPYWAALILTLAAGWAASTLGAGGVVHGPALLWSLLPVPAMAPPVLGIAWSLQCETVFYAVFAVLILDRRAGLAALAIWAAWSSLDAACWAIGHPTPGGAFIPPAIYGRYVVEFLLGLAVSAAVARDWPKHPKPMLAAGLAWMGAAALLETFGLMDGYAPPARLMYGVGAALVVGAMTRLRCPRVLTSLGQASYAIYLFQFLWLEAAWLVMPRLFFRIPYLAWAELTAAGVAGGMVMHMLVEKPAILVFSRIPAWCGCGAATIHSVPANAYAASQNG